MAQNWVNQNQQRAWTAFLALPPRKATPDQKVPHLSNPSYRRASTTLVPAPAPTAVIAIASFSSLRHLYFSTDRCQRCSTRLDSPHPWRLFVISSFRHLVIRLLFSPSVVPSFGLLPSRQPTTPPITGTMTDPRVSSSFNINPHITYNTVGGANGPLVILDNVRLGSSSIPVASRVSLGI